MTFPIGEHALLADGRTAALMDPSGNVAWLCWPRIDSMPMLLSILDEAKGGCFQIRPRDPNARVVSRSYIPGTLVQTTVWAVGDSRLTLDDALAFGGPARLLRGTRASGDPVEVVVRFSPAFDAARAKGEMSIQRNRLIAEHAGTRLMVRSPGSWRSVGEGIAQSEFTVSPGQQTGVILGHVDDPVQTSVVPRLIDDTIHAWDARCANRLGFEVSPLAARVLDSQAAALIQQSAAVILGLQQENGGIVAAPTTSLPQWLGGSRNWDYRYCWLRDGALAALAMIRVGLVDNAYSLAEFLATAAGSVPPRILVRIDGSAHPPETTLNHLAGYGGAQPVRIGNAMADSMQLDVAGEVLELAAALSKFADIPPQLAAMASQYADWMCDHWEDPDHSLFEIRGAPKQYTHSKVMAWSGLRDAVVLAEHGVLKGSASRWAKAASALRHTVLDGSTGPLWLHDEGGGAHSALAQAPLVGFIRPDDARTLATLDSIAGLERGGLLDRYVGQPDGIEAPCGPFIFPTFWFASALEMCGLEGDRYFAAAANSRSATFGLFGEAADPEAHTPLGNYPQVQSHAAFIQAATVDITGH